jgi:hypothetical protein
LQSIGCAAHLFSDRYSQPMRMPGFLTFRLRSN